MAGREPSQIVAIFDEAACVEQVVDDLTRAGFDRGQIEVCVADTDASIPEQRRRGRETKVIEGAAAGIIIGGTLGGVGGAVAFGWLAEVGHGHAGVGALTAWVAALGLFGALFGGMLGAARGRQMLASPGPVPGSCTHITLRCSTPQTSVCREQAIAILRRHGGRGQDSPLI